MARRGKTRTPGRVQPAASPPPLAPAAPTWLGGLLLAAALVFNAVSLAPEIRIGRIPLNDLVFHRAASERLGRSVGAGEPFLEPWVSEWSLGYPVWRSYQPLPHLAAAGVLAAARPVLEPDAAFALLAYAVVVTLPASVFAGARLLGLSPAAAGLAALLVLAPSAPGWGRYGAGYEAFAWRGSGLFTQAVALHFLALALGVAARALDRRRRPTLAGALLALTTLSHIVFGYVAFVSAALFAAVGPRAARAERVTRLATFAAIALVLLAWFLIPLALDREIVNHSRWEEAQKWDSYGARFLLGELFSGRLLDFERGPWLTCLLAAGLAGAVLARRETVAQRLLALAGFWFALFWGRATWGDLVVLAGVPADFPLHRLQAAFELSAILLAAYGVLRLIDALATRSRPLVIAGAAVTLAAVVALGFDRTAYLRQNTAWGDENRAAYARDQRDLEAALSEVRAVLAERPGRAFAGRAAGWGAHFRIGYVPVYAFLTRDHIDQVSFLFHAMSKTSDIMVMRNDESPIDDAAFGVRAVVAPAGQPMPAHLRARRVHGRFAVYEASPEGYFAVVDLAGHSTGPASTHHDTSVEWLRSPLPRRGLVVSLDRRANAGPGVAPGSPIPVPASEVPRRGTVLSERKDGETYSARVGLDRPGYVQLKITWAPGLVATVDGNPAALLHVTPGFGAVAVPSGEHEVVVRYRPGPLKPILLIVGVVLVAWWTRGAVNERPSPPRSDGPPPQPRP